MTSKSSAIYNRKSSGPSTEPCGTPHSKQTSLEQPPLYATRWVRSTRNERIQWMTRPDSPTARCSRVSRTSWSTQSNAALRSSSASNVTRCWSAAAKTSDYNAIWQCFTLLVCLCAVLQYEAWVVVKPHAFCHQSPGVYNRTQVRIP